VAGERAHLLVLRADQEHLVRVTLAVWDNLERRLGVVEVEGRLLREQQALHLAMVAMELRHQLLVRLLHMVVVVVAAEAQQAQWGLAAQAAAAQELLPEMLLPVL
jgi:hypothetical protein